MSDLNRFALYNFRCKLPKWIEQRAQRRANAGDIAEALRLCELQVRAENRLWETCPNTVEAFAS